MDGSSKNLAGGCREEVLVLSPPYWRLCPSGVSDLKRAVSLNAEGVTSVRITEQHTLILNFHPVEETPVDVGISDKPTARERRGV